MLMTFTSNPAPHLTEFDIAMSMPTNTAPKNTTGASISDGALMWEAAKLRKEGETRATAGMLIERQYGGKLHRILRVIRSADEN